MIKAFSVIQLEGGFLKILLGKLLANFRWRYRSRCYNRLSRTI